MARFSNGRHLLPNEIQSARMSSHTGLRFGLTTFATAVVKGSGRHVLGAVEERAFILQTDMNLRDQDAENITITVVNIFPKGGSLIVGFNEGDTAIDTDAKGIRTIPDGGGYTIKMLGHIVDDDDAIAFVLGNGVTVEYEIFFM